MWANYVNGGLSLTFFHLNSSPRKHDNVTPITTFHGMKTKLTDELKEILSQSKNWIDLEIQYAKLTVAEKFTILMTQLIIGAVALIIGNVILVMLAFSLSELFKLFMAPALAYLSVAGIVALLLLVVFLLRKTLLLNPIAKFITKLFIEPKK